MVSIVLGMGALGAALVGGGGAGFYFWKKTEPNHYDAALFMNYKAIYSREVQAADQVDTVYWKHCSDNFLNDNQSTNVVVLGDYKQGKTYLLNGISSMQLETNYTSPMEGIKFKKTSWLSSNKQDVEVLLVDTEGLNHLPGDATNRDLMAKRQGYDNLLMEIAVRLADIPVLVSDKPSIALTQRITQFCNLMSQTDNPRKILIVVYNLSNIESKDDLFQFFEREVALRFNCSKFEDTMPIIKYHFNKETIGGHEFKIVHLPLAREGSEAAKHFHKNTFEVIRYLIELETNRKEETGKPKTSVKMQLAGLAPLFKRALGVTLPKDETSLQYIPLAKST